MQIQDLSVLDSLADGVDVRQPAEIDLAAKNGFPAACLMPAWACLAPPGWLVMVH